MFCRSLRCYLLAASLPLACPLVLAQSTPGSAISESSINADIVNLFALAAQLYPTVFQNGSGWYTYSGYSYKFFPAAGIYAGVKDGSVYLLGGTYGNSLKPAGTVAAITASLQKAVAGTAGSNGVSADFGNITTLKTNYDLPRLFEELTMEWTTISGAVSIVSQLAMVRKGIENVGTVSTEHIQVTLTASNVTTPIVSDLYVDSGNTIRRYISNGFEYAPAQADLIGKGLLSSFLLAMAATESTTVKTALTTAASNPAVAQSTSKKTINGQQYDTLKVSIGAGGAVSYSVDLTDFGSFSMATAYEAKTGSIGSTSFRLISMQLR